MFRVKVVVVKYAKVMMHWHCHGYATNANLKPFHEIPSPKGALPFVGTLFSLMAAGGAENLHEYINERHKQLGAVFRERLGPVTSIFLNDADEIRKVFSLEGRYPKHVLPECWLLYNKTYNYQRGLYFMDGTEWFKYRKILNDVLLKRDYYAEAKKNAIFVEQAFEIWYENSKRGQIIDLENELYNLSLIFIMSFAFGSCFHENADVFLPRIRQLSAVVREIFLHSVKLSVIPATLAMSLNLKIWSDFSQAVGQSVRYTTDLLNELISYKKKKEEDEDADGVVFHLMKRKIDANTLQRIVVDLIMAAGDTVRKDGLYRSYDDRGICRIRASSLLFSFQNAYASLWIFYLLARHKDVQSELYADIQQRGDTETARPSPMIRNVIKESMRLYPVAPFIARYLPEETCVCSYRVPANVRAAGLALNRRG
uniref:Cytochrome P450 315A1 n=1 Tax=Maconellicoccus hirsutus TaxID=177089 RepID=A0AAT9UTI4_MACHI